MNEAFQTEIESLKRDYSFMIGEHLHAKDKRYPSAAWKDIADRTKARIERLEKLVTI